MRAAYGKRERRSAARPSKNGLCAADQAVTILMENCEDAYGFPPYSHIESMLHSRNENDLRAKEREIVAKALSGAPATLVVSSTMDWYKTIPSVFEAKADR